MSQIAIEVAEALQSAAELLCKAASLIPTCDCETLDQQQLSKVVGQLMTAEASAREIHACLRTLQLKHEGKPSGLASLEVGAVAGRGRRRAQLLNASGAPRDTHPLASTVCPPTCHCRHNPLTAARRSRRWPNSQATT